MTIGSSRNPALSASFVLLTLLAYIPFFSVHTAAKLINSGAETAILSQSSQCSAVDIALENDAIALNPSLGPALVRELVTTDVNKVGSDRCMVLHRACRLGACGEVIQALIDMGADVQEPCVGFYFLSPLMLAALGGNPRALEVLLGLPECGGLNARGPLPMRLVAA